MSPRSCSTLYLGPLAVEPINLELFALPGRNEMAAVVGADQKAGKVSPTGRKVGDRSG